MKKIRDQSITGQKGINLIERLVLNMGFLWHPTSGLEAGIDGWIELRDSSTGEMLGGQIFVQSKATETDFQGETDGRLEYLCTEKDLDYWLSGTMPVLLIYSRPSSDEAYWVSVKEHFKDPARRKSRKVHFDKTGNRFGTATRDQLLGLAGPPDAGAYFAPPPRDEVLYTNLLALASLPTRLFIAETDLRTGRAVAECLADAHAAKQNEWVLKNRRILSVHNLRQAPWRSFCDQGTVDDFSSTEWAESDDPDRQRDFVRLLNECLRSSIRRHSVSYRRDQDLYYFSATSTLKDRRISFHSLARKSGRVVFHGYPSKQDAGRIAYYRHSAFEGRFRRFSGRWYLQIAPSYIFTSDGHSVHPYYESKLKGIKALERNPAVLGQIAMWADVLAERRGDLFTSTYPHLRFGELVKLNVDVGIDDQAWLATEENPAMKAAAGEVSALPLFSKEASK